MKNPVAQNVLTCICRIGIAVLVPLSSGQVLFANPASPNDANRGLEDKSASAGADDDVKDAWWKRWDAVVRNPDDPNELVRAKLNAVITVLASEELEQTLKPKIVDKILSPVFDFELMSMLVLGRTHWTKLTLAERNKFTELFTEQLRQTYQDKITLYRDQKIRLSPATPQRMGINISMEILSDDSKLVILYKLREADGRWRIYDVEIEGVSILLTYRSQFDEILRRGGVKSLFDQLNNSAAK